MFLLHGGFNEEEQAQTLTISNANLLQMKTKWCL